MQNIIELAEGECEIFDKTSHLNVKNLKKHSNDFLFIQSTEMKNVEVAQNQEKLITLLNE